MGPLITHLPNTISALRMVLAPIFLYATALDIRLGLMIFIISALSDWLDGYIAKSLVESKGLNASEIIKDLSPLINGSGGGQAFYATGGGSNLKGISSAITKSKEIVNQI